MVTNDTVAVTELVKNCYDAFAYHVEIEFGKDQYGDFIQISDDGVGMTADTIETSWAVIATPYKLKHPYVTRNGGVRCVSGNKGLGRFSAARLGNIMLMWTKSTDDLCIRATIDWQAFMASNNVNDCLINLEVLPDREIFNPTGTIIRIRQLTSTWDEKMIDELKDNLSRLVAPFKQVEDFSIKLISPFHTAPIEIKPTNLIEEPIYKISGSIDDDGSISWKYTFDPKNKKLKSRHQNGMVQWGEAKKGFNTNVISFEEEQTGSTYIAGPFSFEIRAWDLDNDSIEDLIDAFGLKRRAIRSIIGQYKGLSIYRDNVLVLPKSAATKDWLNLDKRRISHLGKRIGTTQIIGLVNISSTNNPQIRDTTDREKLVDTKEYDQFIRLIETIITMLEELRYQDRDTSNEPVRPTMSSLMGPLSAQTLVAKIEAAVEAGKKHQDILEYVREYHAENEKGLTTLQDRLTYYAQTASLGSIAIVILHEMLTGMTVIKRFLRRIAKVSLPFDEKTQEDYDDAERSHARILEVTKSFAPLYRRDLHKAVNTCDLRETLENSIRLIKAQKYSTGVIFENNLSNTIVAKMFDGELQTIFVNILDNACYWLQKKGYDKKIVLSCTSSQTDKRLSISISDTGVGIARENAQAIFEPGITSKPHGIGMGLVIVAEILDYYDGKIATVIPGTLGGATFIFDIPIL